MTSGSGSRACIIAFTIADTEITAEYILYIKIDKGQKMFCEKGIFYGAISRTLLIHQIEP